MKNSTWALGVWALGIGVGILSPALQARGGYVGVGTGIAYSSNERFSETPVLLDYDLGFRVATVTLGYGLDNGLRAELEGAYRKNDLEIIEFADARGAINTGRADATAVSSLMLNAIYDFRLGLGVEPYLGVGAGVGRTRYELSVGATDQVLLDDAATSFAFQLLAGVRVPLGRRLAVAADYRYWHNSKVGVRTEADEPIRTNHPVHQLGISLSYLFNAAERRRRAVDGQGGPWYSELRAGFVAAEDSDIEDGLRDTNFDGFDVGGAVAFALGRGPARGAGRGWRAELEVYRWQNGTDLLDFGTLVGEFRLGGRVRTLGVGANVLYGFGGGVLRPYAGLGAGLADLDYDVTLRDEGPVRQYLDDSDFGFAAQALLGVSARLTPRLSASVNYRYWWAPFVKLTSPAGETWDTEHSAHLMLIGLRYRFGG